MAQLVLSGCRRAAYVLRNEYCSTIGDQLRHESLVDSAQALPPGVRGTPRLAMDCRKHLVTSLGQHHRLLSLSVIADIEKYNELFGQVLH